jgi:3-hydroxyacyl-CoA dehydrogenase/enoyl-CoA hydratase/3-hydroxybutyryl-CoA epimerase
MFNNVYRNFKGELDADKILWISIDRENSATNTLAKEVLEELSLLLDEIAEMKPRALIFISAKKNGFIAGADINEFLKVTDPDSGYELIKRGQDVFDKIEALPFNTVAAIHGFCVGGGMELSLACSYRVVDDSPSARLGLPEVKLGIHPGFGGTVRMTRLIGSLKGMELMLGGRVVNARDAKRFGIVDMAVPPRHLRASAKQLGLKGYKRKKKKFDWKRFADMDVFRTYAARMFRKKTAEKLNKEHYPAPFAMIDLWEKYFGNPKRMYVEEARSVAHLMSGNIAQNLVRVFFLQEKLKSIGKANRFTGKRLHVIGAGTMGGDIAAWGALKGFSVTLQDREAKFIAPAVKRANELFAKKLKEKRAIQEASDRFMPDIVGHGLAKADIVIEAVFEDLDVKREIFAEVERTVKPGAVIATNTSSIPLEQIAETMKNRDRLVGIHFFNPVSMMQLVEVVRGETTSEDAINSASGFVGAIGKLPLVVKSSPGFLVNRILMPYMMEGVLMASEKISPNRIDRAATDFGMPVGPILLADTVGLDICLNVAEMYGEDFNITVPESFRKMVGKGKLGKKSGEGFYKWKGDRAQYSKGPAQSRGYLDIQERLMLRFLNETAASLREGIVDDGDLLDAGMIFGTGFAPFKGGPVNYIKTLGANYFVERLTAMAEKYGERFKPDKGWKDI